MVAAMLAPDNSAAQGRGAMNGSISSDSLDTAVREPSSTTTATTTTTSATTTTTTSTSTTLAATVERTRQSGDESDVDEKTVKLELTSVSAAASRNDVNEDSEDEELTDAVKPTQNAWAAKKTVAQGMMDIALLTSNANQLRYLIMYGQHSTTFAISVTLIAISILLQVAVGVVLIFKGKSDLKGDERRAHANRLNNYVVVGVFLVTIINVFAASFSDVSPTQRVTAAPA